MNAEESLSAVLIRPYYDRLQDPINAQLSRAGLHMDAAPTVEVGTSDRDAVRAVLGADPQVIVAPFNAHADGNGGRLTGLEFCRQLVEASGHYAKVPVVMPLSSSAVAQIRMMCTLGDSKDEYRTILDRQVLLMFEKHINDESYAARLRKHINRIIESDGTAVTESSGVFAIDSLHDGD